MNTVSKLIKGLLITSFAIGVFFINADVQNTKSVAPNAGILAVTADYLADKAYAQEQPATAGTEGIDMTSAQNEVDNLINSPEPDAGDIGDFSAPSADYENSPEPDAGDIGDFSAPSADYEAGGASGGSAASGGSTTDNSGIKVPKNATLPEETLQKIAKASDIIFKIFDPAIFFFTKHIGNFLGSDLIFAGAMGKNLNAIWVISRNIVNVVFVLILLYLAIMHIFGSEEKGDLKKILPKFVIMLIAVNFSWLGAKLIVDAANVATNVVFAIPNGVKGVVTLPKTEEMKCKISADGQKTENDYCTPAEIWWAGGATRTINMKEADCLAGGKTITSSDGKNVTTEAPNQGYSTAYPQIPDENNPGNTVDGEPNPESPYYQTITFCWADLDIGKFDSSNAAFQLTYSMAKVQNLAKSESGSLPKLAIGTIFALFIKVVYLLAFGSLLIALVIRMAMLWILVAFSPFIVLMLFLETDVKISGGEEIKKFLSMKAFTKWAFAPAKVAAVWTIGYIMITTGQTATTDIFNRFESSATVPSKVFEVSSIFMGMNSLDEMIWLIMTIGIIWMGTFGVLKDLEVASKVTNWINDRGKNFANFLGGLPMAAPIIPTIDPEGGGLSFKKRTNLETFMKENSFRSIHDRLAGGDGMGLAQASVEFAKKTDISKLTNALKDNKFEAAMEEFNRINGFSKEQTAKGFTEASLRDFLNGNNAIDKSKSDLWAKEILKQARAKGGPADPKLSAQPPTAPALSKGELTEAFKKAISGAEIQARIKGAKLSDDDVIKKAVELKTAEPKMEEGDALTKAIEELKKEATEKGKGKPDKPPAGNPPAAPAAPKTKP